MKHIALFLTIIIIISSCNRQQPQGVSNDLYTINKNEINLHFSSKFRSEDLENIQMTLDSFGIFIIYDSLEFYENGGLKHISARVFDSNDNRKIPINSGSRELTEEPTIGFQSKLNPWPGRKEK